MHKLFEVGYLSKFQEEKQGLWIVISRDLVKGNFPASNSMTFRKVDSLYEIYNG